MKVNKFIDHTLLKPNSTSKQIETLCKEAVDYDFKSVCVNPTWVSRCHKLLTDSDVLVCTVIGFPLGAQTSETKAFETTNAVENGADEIDMVLNIGALKSNNYNLVESDIKAVVKAAGGKTVKVILETCLLTDEEIKRACEISLSAKAHFVKTSTGFSTGGASEKAVKIMKDTVGDNALIKASGGIRSYEDAKKYIDLGATRLGASAGVSIMKGLISSESY